MAWMAVRLTIAQIEDSSALWLLVDGRSVRMRCVWSRPDLLVLAASHVTAVPARLRLVDALSSPWVTATTTEAGRSRIVPGVSG